MNPLDVYRHLPQTNCGRCYLPSCLAFAAALVAGTRKPDDCPLLAAPVRAELTGSLMPRSRQEPEQAEFISRLEKKVRELDFPEIAARRGARLDGERLAINSLGKEFFIDRNGTVTSECHIIPWVRAPLLSYITHPTHLEISGEWISFRELQGGIDWQGLFTSRCEIPLRKLADHHPGLFADLIDLFMGRETEGFDADIAMVLHPLPHIPLLFCYQAPEDELDSVLTIFFDGCCAHNLHIKSLYTLCAGLVHMFDKIAQLHT